MAIEKDTTENNATPEAVPPPTATIQALIEENQKLQDEVEQLKLLLEDRADAKTAKKPKFTENYSVGGHERKQQQQQPRKKSTGRRPFEAKRKLATREIDIYPEGVPRENGVRHRSQLVWRIFDGKAVYVCYHIYDVPESQTYHVLRQCATSKSESGAHRRSVIITVLASLQTRIDNFTLSNLLEQVHCWLQSGSSIFQQELAKLHSPNAPPVAPIPSC